MSHTAQPTSPKVEICTKRPDADLTFNSRQILTIAPAKNQGTQHNVSMDGLDSGTLYYFVISVWDRNGKVVKSDGRFTTAFRIDP